MRDYAQPSIALEQFLRPIFLTLFVCGVCGYALFQARYLISGPQVVLHEPTETMQHDRRLTLRGTAENITSITLNGREIYTDEHGNFVEPLVLENGYTIMTLHAENRYGHTVDVSRSFVYHADTTTN